MLKLLFWLLLAVNAALFALGQGYLGYFQADAHEPQRLKNQLNSEKLRLISAADAARAVPAPAPPELFACTEVGNFLMADARRFEAAVDVLALGERQSRRNVAGQEISSYIVYIPPQGSKEGADKKAGELKQLGVSNYFIMSDNTPMRWAISLGVFKLEAGAQNLLASLNKQGVHSARVAPRYSGSKQLAFQFRDLDRAGKTRLAQIAAGFPEQEMHSCK
ncbi:SPOR domain-containing protein [Janthinobacterium fluminis]|uniref:SPOR domain-containing protein n=1 Tax=Janthinobacterium fluminis TaxID=2987524 RepID=A0ABT5K845_9BURK|nr:SPOR domain-containing protein [Janthinobacterium fluminis]MDC8760615.1 SPOR domain-containing protein [Janthinobacterium fluminis]